MWLLHQHRVRAVMPYRRADHNPAGGQELRHPVMRNMLDDHATASSNMSI